MTEIILLSLLFGAAATDWRRQKISNMLTIPYMLAGVLYQWWQGAGGMAVAGLLCAFVLTVLPVAVRGMGMGDQKLLMAMGAWTSHEQVYSMFLQSLWMCLLPVIFLPSAWVRLHRNLSLLAVGWAAHRQFWLPGRGQSALRIPYAIPLLTSYLLHLCWR
jgi:prepilin peptidase CpaA